MKVVLQRVAWGKVSVEEQVVGEISKGVVLFVGIGQEDTAQDVDYLAGKISKTRIFEDEFGKMNVSIQDIGGQILSISQFTLYGNTKKGNRPSFTKAAAPSIGQELYELFNQKLEGLGLSVSTGQFGAHMQVELENDGPVTLLFDTEK